MDKFKDTDMDAFSKFIVIFPSLFYHDVPCDETPLFTFCNMLLRGNPVINEFTQIIKSYPHNVGNFFR